MNNRPYRTILSIFAVLGFLIFLSTCGKLDRKYGPPMCNLVTSPTATGAWTTNASPIYLSGWAYHSDCFQCTATPAPGGPMHWENRSAGTTGDVQVGAVVCGIAWPAGGVCDYPWNASVPLVEGANEIWITAADGCNDDITVTFTP